MTAPERFAEKSDSPLHRGRRPYMTHSVISRLRTAALRMGNFAERGVMEFSQIAQFANLIFANLMTLAHFSASLAMSVPKSAGEPVNIMPPRAAKRVFIS
jgi:hypothetical protein